MITGTIFYNFKNHDIILSEDNTHIQNSYLIETRKDMMKVLQDCRDLIKPSDINNYAIYKRDLNDMVNEWCVHNLLYKLNIAKTRTESVDLNYPIKWYMKFIYKLLSKLY